MGLEVAPKADRVTELVEEGEGVTSVHGEVAEAAVAGKRNEMGRLTTTEDWVGAVEKLGVRS